MPVPLPLLAAVTLTFADGSGASVRSIPGSKSVALDLSTSPSATLGYTRRNSGGATYYRPIFALIDVTGVRAFAVQHYAGTGYSWSMPRLTLSIGLTGSYGRTSFVMAAAQAAQPTAATPMQNGMPANQDTGMQGGNTPAGGGNQGTGQTGGMQGTGQTGTGQTGGMQGAGTQMPGGMQAPANGNVPTTQYFPQVQVLDTANAALTLGMSYALARTVGMGLGVGYSMGGGIRGSERFLPFRHGPNAGANLGVQVSKDDGLGTGLSAAVDFVPVSNSRFFTINFMEGWNHRFSANAAGTLGLGATYLQSRQGVTGETTRGVNAAAQAGIGRGFKLEGGATMSLSAGAGLGTTYNPVLGTFYQGLGGGGYIGWSKKKLTLNAGVTGSHSLPFDSPTALRSYGASAGASYGLTTFASLNLGGYWTHQVLPITAVNAYPDMWGATLSIVLVAPPIKF